MMTLKFFGFILSTSCFSLVRSSCDSIFVLTETLSENGTSTRLRPAMDISADSRGPLVEMGSLTTCTKTFCPALM